MKPGAIILGAIFLILSMFWLTLIIENPLIYSGWGNFFIKFSMAAGAMIVYSFKDENKLKISEMIGKLGYIFFGISVISFALYQLFFMTYTASLVPRWVPPGQMFWVILTTIAFVLAATAILSGRAALLASQLLTVMLILFGLLVYIPKSFIHPNDLSNWNEIIETFLIAGAAWVTADYLYKNRIANLLFKKKR